jgi:hypothetical protein
MASVLNSDTAVWRGVRTAIQAMIGFVVGLVGTVWAVPGVPAAVNHYVEHNVITLALAVGIPAGIAGFIWNALRKGVKTY